MASRCTRFFFFLAVFSSSQKLISSDSQLLKKITAHNASWNEIKKAIGFDNYQNYLNDDASVTFYNPSVTLLIKQRTFYHGYNTKTKNLLYAEQTDEEQLCRKLTTALNHRHNLRITPSQPILGDLTTTPSDKEQHDQRSTDALHLTNPYFTRNPLYRHESLHTKEPHRQRSTKSLNLMHESLTTGQIFVPESLKTTTHVPDNFSWTKFAIIDSNGKTRAFSSYDSERIRHITCNFRNMPSPLSKRYRRLDFLDTTTAEISLPKFYINGVNRKISSTTPAKVVCTHFGFYDYVPNTLKTQKDRFVGMKTVVLNHQRKFTRFDKDTQTPFIKAITCTLK